jgi:hypothetical protein
MEFPQRVPMASILHAQRRKQTEHRGALRPWPSINSLATPVSTRLAYENAFVASSGLLEAAAYRRER